jgi:hypothetical protein
MEKEECCGGEHMVKRQFPCLMIIEEGLIEKCTTRVVHFFVYSHKE